MTVSYWWDGRGQRTRPNGDSRSKSFPRKESSECGSAIRRLDAAADAEYVLSVDGKEQSREDAHLPTRSLEDEFYLAVPSSGEHTLLFSVRNLPATAEFGLKLLEFSVPRTQENSN